jgi:hypothetical protein
MFFLPIRGASYSDYYSPHEISDHYKSILDPDNIIRNTSIDVAQIQNDSDNSEYFFRDNIVNDILLKFQEMDYLLFNNNGSINIYSCNFNINQYLITLQCNWKNKIVALKKRYNIQKSQFELFCSLFMTQPSLGWLAFYVNTKFLDIPNLLDALLEIPMDLERIKSLADAYCISKINEFKIKHSSIIKEFSCSYDDLQIKKRWRLKEAKKSYLENNPYFKKW